MAVGDVMGASADLYAQRMRSPEPDEGDQWVLDVARAVQAKHERHVRRMERVIEVLRQGAAHETLDDVEVFV